MKKTIKQSIKDSIEALSIAKALLIIMLVFSILAGIFIIVEDNLALGIYIILSSIIIYFFVWILLQIWNAINITNKQMEDGSTVDPFKHIRNHPGFKG